MTSYCRKKALLFPSAPPKVPRYFLRVSVLFLSIFSFVFWFVLWANFPVHAQENILAKLEMEISSMVEKVGPSVVSVRTQRIRRVDWLSRLRQGIFKRNSVEWQIDLGTGVALDSTGHILTTQDVVYGAEDRNYIFLRPHTESLSCGFG